MMIHKTLQRVANLSAALAIALCAASPAVNTARAEGLNSENFYPAHDMRSGILWETPRTIQERSFLFEYTSSYALHPVEFGDGKSERLSVSDHLQVNHLGIGYGIMPWFDMGLDMPIALYSAPSSVGGYIPAAGLRDRNFFFPGDLRLRTKMNFDFIESNIFKAAANISVWFPTGTPSAMLSDDSFKVSLEMPMLYAIDPKAVEYFFTPGISYWSQKERVYASPILGRTYSILTKEKSLLLQFGARYWLVGSAENLGLGTLLVDGGIRGDFQDFKPTLNGRGSPVEWSVGSAFFLKQNLSIHGSYGTGIGTGVGAPLSRLVAGVKYLSTPLPKVLDESAPSETMLSSSAYSDYELNELMKQAQAEPAPPRLGEDESLLRMKNAGEIVDLGRIRFEFNSATLTKQALEVVYRLHEQLLALNPSSIRIEGHTDSIGSYKYNLPLSKRRAESVKAELVRLGHSPAIIAAEGFAFKFPVASNATQEGRAANRRIEVALNGESFRNAQPTPEERRQREEWIAPGGKQPSKNQ